MAITRATFTPLFIALMLAAASPLAAQTSRFTASVEGASIWLARNDVRIPPVGGTDFSVVDLIGKGPTSALRADVTFDVNDRHGFRATWAPLEVTGSGVPDLPIAFAGGNFAAGQSTDAAYKFSSYRGTYRYRFYNGDRWSWRVGFTGFVRDARIALTQPGVAAEDTDIGFVPLAHLDAEARLSDRWRLAFDVDGSAAPQGRAFDISAKAHWTPTPRFNVGFGYRTIEGGADVDAVYNFAWLNFAVVSVGVGF